MSSLGNKLRDARIEKGYTLNTLQQMTKIQKKYLVAIEENNFKELPGTFYIRAFVKQYADVVGLNGDDLLEIHKSELELDTAESDLLAIENIESEEIGSRVKARQANMEKDNTEVLLSYLPLAFLVLVIISIIISLILAISRMNSTSRNDEIAQVTSTSIVSTVAPDSAATTQSQNQEQEDDTATTGQLAENQIRVGDAILTRVSAEGEETVYEIQGSDFSNYEFSVEGSGFVWVGMYEDEVMVVDTTISADETFDYSVTNPITSFRMRLGYPDGGTFKVNGTDLVLNNSVFPDTVVFRIASEATAVSDQESTTQETSSETSGE
ncbi:TPA: helix-turn-helix domain-containing protein [Streptococcus suis]